MSHQNPLVSFLRHYGPIAASDNMYDELIQTEIERYGVEPPIKIEPTFLKRVIDNFSSACPRSVILTGTAGDGKTYHCRCVFTAFGGNSDDWHRGEKLYTVSLPGTGKQLCIVKDLSELTVGDKEDLFPKVAASVAGENDDTVFLIAANDGQLLASWRDWAESQHEHQYQQFKIIEKMLVEENSENNELFLLLYNLSRCDASEHFEKILEQVIKHPHWDLCTGCELLHSDGSTTCPIRLNRERLMSESGISLFKSRLSQLLKLSHANRMNLPIRDLLLLSVNILFGDQQSKGLLTCRMAQNRAKKQEYRSTNPYANVFGANLPDRQRAQYQAFSALEAFGIGKETDNQIDNLLIYGPYAEQGVYDELVGSDGFYGGNAYRLFLQDYLEGERENIQEFMRSLTRQRQRLFFSLPHDGEFEPWSLSVYQSAGQFLEFAEKLDSNGDSSKIISLLVRGLNRTFCGMMIDEDSTLFLTSSGGDGRGRFASILNFEIKTVRNRRDPYLDFKLAQDGLTPCLQIVDPQGPEPRIIDSLELQVTHFEYLMRVARGSLPASFSRQCYEDFLDFKLRAVERLDKLMGVEPRIGEVTLEVVTVDERGRPQPENIRIMVSEQ